MVCPQCGARMPVGEARCPACTPPPPAPLDASDDQPRDEASSTAVDVPSPDATEAAASQRLRRRRRVRRALTAVFALLLLACVVTGVSFWRWYTAPPRPMEAMLPADAAIVATLDAPWLWTNLHDTPQVRARLAEVEQGGEFAFEQDIAPWLGRMVVAVPPVPGPEGKTQFAVLLEIRDKAKFRNRMGLLASGRSRKTGQTITRTRHAGISIYHLDIQVDGLACTAAIVDGWLVLGYGQSTVEWVVNAARRKAPAMATNPDWARARARVSTGRLVYYLSGKGIAGAVGDADAFAKTGYSAHHAYALGLSDTDDGLRADLAILPITDDGRTWLKTLREQAPSGATALRALPADTRIALALPSPAHWHAGFAAWLDTAGPQAKSKGGNDALLPLTRVLRGCTGTTNMGLAWRKGTGMGVVLSGMTDTAKDARQSCQDIKALVVGKNLAVTTSGDLQRLMPAVGMDDDIGVLPAWRAQDRRFVYATHVRWAKAAGPPTLDVPPDANDACALFVADLETFPELLAHSSRHVTQENRACFDAVKALNLQTMTLAAWAEIDPAGDHMHVALRMRGWDWRAGIAAGAARAEDLQAIDKLVPALMGGNMTADQVAKALKAKEERERRKRDARAARDRELREFLRLWGNMWSSMEAIEAINNATRRPMGGHYYGSPYGDPYGHNPYSPYGGGPYGRRRSSPMSPYGY